MKDLRFLIGFLFVAASVGATAQPQQGPAGRGCNAASAVDARAPDCDGPMGGRGPRGRWGPDDTPGWPMMSRGERRQHHDRMSSFKTYDECKAYMDKHHADMAARAKERGRTMPAQPVRDACAALKEKPKK